jgi:hypothetical protein
MAKKTIYDDEKMKQEQADIEEDSKQLENATVIQVYYCNNFDRNTCYIDGFRLRLVSGREINVSATPIGEIVTDLELDRIIKEQNDKRLQERKQKRKKFTGVG